MTNNLTALLGSIMAVLLVVGCAPAATPTPLATAPTSTLTPPAPAQVPATATPLLPGAPSPTPVPPTPTPMRPLAATPRPPEGAPQYGGTLLESSPDAINRWDIHKSTGAREIQCLGKIYSGLLQYDPLQNEKIIPDLAESWEASQDHMVYTFHLRKGVKWHDGKPFTAEDAKYSLDRLIGLKGFESPRGASIVKPYVKKVEVVDPYTLRISLPYPAVSFLPTMASGWTVILPKHVLEGKGSIAKPEDIIGTGPYKFDKVVPSSVFKVVKNPAYFLEGRPYLDGINIYVIPDRGTMISAFKTKRIHFTCRRDGITFSEAKLLANEFGNRITIWKGSMSSVQGFFINGRKPPFDSRDVRRAVFLAADRQRIIDYVSEGWWLVGSPLSPDTEWSLSPEELLKMPGLRQPKDEDLAEARKLLAKAGYSTGFKTKITSSSRTVYADPAQLIRQDLAKIGIDADTELLDPGVWDERMYSGDFLLGVQGHGLELIDPSGTIGMLYVKGGARHVHGVVIPRVEELFLQQAREFNPTKRKEILREIQLQVMEDPGFVPYAWRVIPQAMWNEVRNYKFPLLRFNHEKYQDVWLAK